MAVSVSRMLLDASRWGVDRGLATDATHLYVGTADGRVLEVAKTGGAALALARTDLYAGALFVMQQTSRLGHFTLGTEFA